MTNSDKNFISCKELFALAIEMEKESAAFYRRLQEMTKQVDVIELLKLLEKQELEHGEILSNFDLSSYADEIIQFPPDFANFTTLSKSNDELSFDEILTIATQSEGKSINIYEHAASIVNGQLRELFTALANFEKNHMEKIKNLSYY